MTFWKTISVLSVVTFFVYFPSFFNPFIWDDEQFIYNNEFVKNFKLVEIFTQNTIAGAGEQSHYFRPFTTASFAWDYLWWGDNPFGFHFVNTLIHIGAGIFLALYLKLMNIDKKISIFVVAVFLLHPIQTEAVTYINSRGDSLYTFFLLISLCSFIFLLKNKIYTHTLYDLHLKVDSKIWAIISICTFAAAILSKELAIAGLGLHFITYLFYSKNNSIKIPKKHFLMFAALILILVFYAIARLTIWSFPSGYEVDFEQSPYHANIALRFFTAFKIYLLYFGIILTPYPLHMERSTEIVNNFFNPWLLGVIALTTSILFLIYKENKLFKTKWILFGWLWFTGLFIPISGLIPSVGMLYEHWLYLPSIGFSICFGYMLKVLFNSFNFKDNIYSVFLIILISIFSSLTIYQNYLWGDHIRFYTYTLQFNKTARIHNNLAMAYADRNDLDNAIKEYQQAITIGDYYPQTHYNLGNAFASQQKYQEALIEYKRAIEMNRYFIPAYTQQIKVYQFLNQPDEAIKISETLLNLEPNNRNFLYLHGQTLFQAGKKVEAQEFFEKTKKSIND